MKSELIIKIAKFLRKRKIVTILAILLILWIVVSVFSTESTALLYEVKQGKFVIDLEVQGEMQALESFVVKAPRIRRSLRIVRLVPEGTIVKKGDFLIQFDTSELQQELYEELNNLERAKANLAQTVANIRSQEAELESNIKLEKYSLEQSKLQAKNAIYESENKRKEIEFNLKKAEISYQQLLERKEATAKINAASLKQAQLEVKQAEMEVQEEQNDIDKLTINSETDGLVVYKQIWEGNGMGKIKVGSTPWRGMALMEIPTQNKMKVAVKIDEIDISKLALDQNVEITLDAVSDTMFTGSVKTIASLANRDERTRKNVFDVEIYLNEFDERLKPGMTAHSRIIIDEIEDVISVPIDAVITEEERTIVYNGNGSPVEIKTGLANSNFIIVEEGLKEGDAIQLKGAQDSGTIVERESKKKKKKSSSESESVFIIG
jgi:multidrug efflux pump subunit AcrA (membrane-fusion protein)